MRCFRANTDKVAWRVVDGEAVLMHADTSAYYGLNATGTYIWETMLAGPLTPEDIAGQLSAQYDVRGATVRRDVETFFDSLGEERLLLEVPRPADQSDRAGGPDEARRHESRYEPPRLDRFGELEKLVLSGE